MRAVIPALTTLSLPQLRALDTALRAAEAAATVIEAQGGAFGAALYADAEGVSVTFTVPIRPQGDRDVE